MVTKKGKGGDKQVKRGGDIYKGTVHCIYA